MQVFFRSKNRSFSNSEEKVMRKIKVGLIVLMCNTVDRMPAGNLVTGL